MAIRTGTQLKTDMGAVETALDAIVTTPSKANYDTLIAAIDVVVTNARDSIAITASDARGKIFNNYNRAARELRREVLWVANHHASPTDPVGPTRLYSKARRTFVTALQVPSVWPALKTTPTTD